MENENNNIVFFDDVCVLCSRTVQFILKHDKKGIIKFAPNNSSTAETVFSSIKRKGFLNADESIVYFRKGNIHISSEAVLFILKDMGSFWSLFYVFRFFPGFIRNYIYRLIAKNRYKIFGKRDSCFMPDKNQKRRFLS